MLGASGTPGTVSAAGLGYTGSAADLVSSSGVTDAGIASLANSSGALDLGAAAGAGDAAAAGAVDAAAAGAGDAAAAGAGGFLGDVAAAAAWIVCTELHKQGRMPNKWYITGFRKFSKYSEDVKRGYYIWAIPSVKHLRKNPNSKFSKFLEWVFVNRAEYIAAQYGVRGAKKTLKGFFILTSTYALCWTLSRTIARKPIDWTVLYKNEAKS